MKNGGFRRHFQIVTGVVIGAALLWWLFRDTHWGEVGRAVSGANWAWLAASVGMVLVSFVVRVARWGFIVRTDPPVPFMRLFNATQIGFLANFVLPARMGEVIRALVLSRGTGIPVSRSIAYVAVDRVTDLAGLAAVLLITVVTFHPKGDIRLPEAMRGFYDGPVSDSLIRSASLGVGAAIVVGMAGLALLFALRNRIIGGIERVFGGHFPGLAARLVHLTEQFTAGMSVIGSPWRMTQALLASLALWVCFALTNVCAFQALHLDVPWYTTFVTLSLVAVFISLPGPPGFIGPFHAGVAGSLLLANPDLDMDLARAMAIVGHFINLIPVVVVGVWCLSTEKLSLRQLQEEGDEIAEGGGGPEEG